jgi:DNA primase
MSFPPSFLEHVKQRILLSDVIGGHVALKRRGKEFTGLCPFHSEKSPSFTVNDEKAFYHCFGCGAHGNVFDFLIQKEGMTFGEAVKYAANLANLPLPLEESLSPTPSFDPLYEVLDKASKWFQENLHGPQGNEARSYLEKRGLTPQIIQKFRLGFAPAQREGVKSFLLSKKIPLSLIASAGLLSSNQEGQTYDKFRGRIIFPITSAKGKIIAFGGRSLHGEEPKYLNSPETPVFHKGHTLYHYYGASKSLNKDQPLMVVEGYLDVISMVQYGYERVVAPLGTALTTDQITTLWKLDSEPILCFDGDNAGKRAEERAIERALPLLKPGYSLRFMELPSGDDPDTFVKSQGLEGLRKLIPSCQTLVEKVWTTELMQVTPKTPEQKALLEKNLLKKADLISDLKIRNFYRQDLVNRFYQWQKTSRSYKSHSVPLKIDGKKNIYDSLKLQQQILLSTFLEFPQLLHEFAEDFSLISFADEIYEDLRQEILSKISDQQDLEKETLASYLCYERFQNSLEELKSSKLWVHAPFLKPGSSLDAARQGWIDIWKIVQAQQVQLEREHLKQELLKNFSLEIWNRYQALNEVIDLSEEENS